MHHGLQCSRPTQLNTLQRHMYLSGSSQLGLLIGSIFVPIEDLFMHWYCLVIDFGNWAVYHLDSYPEQLIVGDREKVMRDVLKKVYEVMTCNKYGPFGVYTPTDIPNWPFRRAHGIPNCNTSDSSAAWVISCLHLEGQFNQLDISGVLDDYTLRGETAVALAGGPFNELGLVVRLWAAQ
ncbi:hypothetical protein PIB30_035434 [Stylosanthes scabra]|uniref:Ubiquitin-like protease family profile domain-containing protein n=1 Tax=Stylosanthes scabra TaxID=79078 RepID=A0ABU6SDC8_9FABA|nr:hypothetical protein [Stylosanthes scabra]